MIQWNLKCVDICAPFSTPQYVNFKWITLFVCTFLHVTIFTAFLGKPSYLHQFDHQILVGLTFLSTCTCYRLYTWHQYIAGNNQNNWPTTSGNQSIYKKIEGIQEAAKIIGNALIVAKRWFIQKGCTKYVFKLH